MEPISVFDMLKVGVGPSSSHTLGPWRAAQAFTGELEGVLPEVTRIEIGLYGSLALTGKGHGTDIALLLGLSNEDPEIIPIQLIQELPQRIRAEKSLDLAGVHTITFEEEKDLIYHPEKCLDRHANGMMFKAFDKEGALLREGVYYSIGGGFIQREGEEGHSGSDVGLPYPIQSGQELLDYCRSTGKSIAGIVFENEKAWRTEAEIESALRKIWDVMRMSVYRGCHSEGMLPGGLQVKRRAPGICRNILGPPEDEDPGQWMKKLITAETPFARVLKLIGCFAMAVNEENANFGRIVTAPTNGAAGVIPAVLHYYICFSEKEVSDEDIFNFLLVAGEIGSIFKKGATISAAMGGCQAEIGVSSSMAAAALTEGMGGSPAQALMAAEMAMEHHLGLTCDPVGGLVQVPCIERNSMGAVKAITAANIALESEPEYAKISLDDVVAPMWETAKDMNSKYKETSQGGLAARISIKVPEC